MLDTKGLCQYHRPRGQQIKPFCVTVLRAAGRRSVHLDVGDESSESRPGSERDKKHRIIEKCNASRVRKL